MEVTNLVQLSFGLIQDFTKYVLFDPAGYAHFIKSGAGNSRRREEVLLNGAFLICSGLAPGRVGLLQ